MKRRTALATALAAIVLTAAPIGNAAKNESAGADMKERTYAAQSADPIADIKAHSQELVELSKTRWTMEGSYKDGTEFSRMQYGPLEVEYENGPKGNRPRLCVSDSESKTSICDVDMNGFGAGTLQEGEEAHYGSAGKRTLTEEEAQKANREYAGLLKRAVDIIAGSYRGKRR